MEFEVWGEEFKVVVVGEFVGEVFLAVEGDGCFVAPGAGDVADGVASAAEDEDGYAVFEHVFDAFAVALGGKKRRRRS